MSQTTVNVNINFPDGLLDTMNYETVIINPASENIGIAILSQKTQDQQEMLIKIFVIHLDSSSEDAFEYNTSHELQSYIFPDETSAQNFIAKLPYMSAIELMFAQHSPQYQN
ncbi:hypothetical protein [Bacillus infantis]|uniref:hypothetical protein n=1 Tax=Bacillus infantis TaxID=324767 RepID=UPI002155BA76|nr:hypothetical protein [Bacillus infantis]MCR6610602.1 hypothetical protein [Bacillus infantis]